MTNTSWHVLPFFTTTYSFFTSISFATCFTQPCLTPWFHNNFWQLCHNMFSQYFSQFSIPIFDDTFLLQLFTIVFHVIIFATSFSQNVHSQHFFQKAHHSCSQPCSVHYNFSHHSFSRDVLHIICCIATALHTNFSHQ